MRNSGGGGEYGPGDGGEGRRTDGHRSSYGRPNQSEQGDAGAGIGGRWQNDLFDSNAQQPRGHRGRRGGGYQERGDYQHDQHYQRGDGKRGKGRGYGGGGGGDNYGGESRGNARGGGGGGYGDENQGYDTWPNPGGASGGVGDARNAEVGNGEGGGEGGTGGGGERWQRHAQALSARSGGGSGGGYHAQLPAQHNQRPMVSDEKEQGRVCSLKESFGFVRCMDRPGDLFFHLTEAPPNINVGDEVDFVVGNRSGKYCALRLNVLPPGTVSSEVVFDALFLGVIERDIRPYPSSMPSTHRANMMRRSRSHETQQAEGLIKITGAAPPEDAQAVAEDTTAQEGENAQGSLETENSVAGEGSAANDSAAVAPEPDKTAAAPSLRPLPAGDGEGVPPAPLGLQGAMVTYLATDALEENAGSRFKRGDEVRFKVSQDKGSGRKRAVEVVLVRTYREKKEENQLKELIDSGATRQQGVVKKLTHDYGFLQSLSSSDTVYFSTAHVLQTREGERLRVGSQAEFWVVPDRTKDRRDSFRALEIKILPPGTLTLEVETHTKLRGKVERAPTMPQRQGFGSGRDGGGGGGGIHPGTARFAIPAVPAQASPDGGEELVAATTAPSVVASLNLKELVKSQVPTLEVGDIIEADLWKSNLGGRTTQAKNVKLVSFGGERVEGVVKSLRDGGFGFIRPLGETEDVYFRICDTCKGLPDLREGSEVMFTQHKSERGGEKKRATRVEVYPKGTLQMEVPLGNDVSGVVTRNTKGSGLGTITITDGNDLDIPADVKFPKIAAQIREFAGSNEKLLVFPAGLSAGERTAAHSLAAGEGLGHESRGEEGSRALHVWKPENEEEVAHIKEAEERRAESRSNAAKERSKNGERSLTVSFSREDIVATKPDGESQDPEKASNIKGEAGGDEVHGVEQPQERPKSNLTQDFRTEKGFAGFAAAAQRGDLVTFDVVLNKGNMKRRATNVKVTKRAATQISSSNITLGNKTSDDDGQAGASGQDQEYVGVVSLVQLERHYGFIEVLDMDERVFFHLSEVLPDDSKATNANEAGSVAHNDSGGVAEKAPEAENIAAITTGSGGSSWKPVIKRGQEVAFRLGQRQGKPLGLRVRKLRPGTLPTEESLPCRFVGVVVVPPRNIATDKDKDPMASAAGMEGMLVTLYEKDAVSGDDNAMSAEPLPTPPQAEGAIEQQDEGSAAAAAAATAAEEVSAREAEKEANKAQRMLGLAGIRVTSASLGGASPLSNPSAQMLLNPNVVSAANRRSSRGGGSAARRGPPRFSVLRFLASIGGEGVLPAAAAEDVAASSVTVEAGEGGAVSFGRGDLVEFTVQARMGQGHQNHRVGKVSLLAKAAIPCLRGKVYQVDAKAGVAHVNLLQQDENSTPVENAKDQGAEAAATTTATAAATTERDATAEGQGNAPAGADGRRVFFLLKEMVGAAGPLRKGDEVDFMLPPPLRGLASQKSKSKNLANSGHAVGAVRVQDLKSLSGARQRLNINLRESQKGPQVRMALGPDGSGFKQGHRASPSLYADKGVATKFTKVGTERLVSAAGVVADAAVGAKMKAPEVDAAESVDETDST